MSCEKLTRFNYHTLEPLEHVLLGASHLFQLCLFPHLNLPEVSIPVTNLKTSFSNDTRCLSSRKIVEHVHPHLFKHIHCRLGDDVNIASNYVISRSSILVEIHVKNVSTPISKFKCLSLIFDIILHIFNVSSS